MLQTLLLKVKHLQLTTKRKKHLPLKLLIGQLGDLCAFQSLIAFFHQANIAGYLFCCAPVIAGDHLDLDAGMLRNLDGSLHALAHRIFHAEQPDLLLEKVIGFVFGEG